MAQLRGYLAAYGPSSDTGVFVEDAAAAVREIRDAPRGKLAGAFGAVDEDRQ